MRPVAARQPTQRGQPTRGTLGSGTLAPSRPSRSAGLQLLRRFGSGSAGALRSPADIGPNDVRIYEHTGYVGQSRTYEIPQGAFQLEIPDLGWLTGRCSSIEVGSRVGVLMLQGKGFRGGGIRLYSSRHDLEQKNEFNDECGSAIVHLRDPSDVVTEWGGVLVWEHRRLHALRSRVGTGNDGERNPLLFGLQ